MSLPQTNATLTTVGTAGLAEDFDRPAGAAGPKWTGSESVYFSERSERVVRGDATEIVISRAVITADALGIDWAQGDQLTVIHRGEPIVGIVRAIERHQIPDVPLATVRLTLEDQ